MLKWLFNLGKKDVEKKQEIESLKKKALENFKKGMDDIIGDKSFKEHYKNTDKTDIEDLKRNALNTFLTIANRLEKNILKEKIVKSNLKIIGYFHDYKKNKKVKKILDELQEKGMITLEELEILKEEFKKSNEEFWEKEIK
jgi:hypothetical protein|nr:MAG TPA: hypothetical protein [Caudoviricetes sp.]